MGIFRRRKDTKRDVSTEHAASVPQSPQPPVEGSEGGAHPGQSTDVGPAVAAFWQWWEREGHQIVPSEMAMTPLVQELQARVQAIDEGLTWHFGRGGGPTYRLTLSANGNPASRPAAERWVEAAPPTSEQWEFFPSQQPDEHPLSGHLEIGDSTVQLPETCFAVTQAPEESRVHVGVFNPAFATLPEELASTTSFMVLDWVLGEDAVERWVGHIEVLTEPPATPVGFEGVREAVDRMVQAREPDGWALAQASDEGWPVSIVFRTGMRWIDRPVLDRHVIVSVPYQAGENGFPVGDAVFPQLQQVEDELDAALGSAGLLVAAETSRGTRQLHYYVDSEDTAAAAAFFEVIGRHPVDAEGAQDPGWRHVRHYTG